MVLMECVAESCDSHMLFPFVIKVIFFDPSALFRFTIIWVIAFLFIRFISLPGYCFPSISIIVLSYSEIVDAESGCPELFFVTVISVVCLEVFFSLSLSFPVGASCVSAILSETDANAGLVVRQ